ncbi:uncharacterized protein LOC133906228 [Phragmites australis]|uniref:uncharacterized protein LOC133906228 n=1 Tax=Phragmites australis TaxID=29695 RepID=UPI002D7A1877|nr:uncharacterized protein LOC133906228 [Phragmites australis]
MTVGLALLLDLASRAPRCGASSVSAHSHGGLSAAAAAATAAAALSASGVPLSARHLFGFPGFTIAHCDAGAAAGLNDAPDLVNDLNNKIRDSIQYARKEYFQYPAKEYPLELKPLFSAFGLKNFSVTTLRSFLLYYLPLIQPKPQTDSDDDDDDLLHDAPEEKHVDLITPFHNSVKQIIRETSIVTTRRVLERIAVCHVSQRTAWKLLKDASKSARRKAARGMSTPEYTYCVARTTFRAHALGVAAAWVVQSIIEVYRCFIRKPSDDEESFDDMEKFRLFGRKIYGITIKSCFSLVLASIGAGIGALVHPRHGQWFGCALGDVAGPVVAIIIFEKMQLPL